MRTTKCLFGKRTEFLKRLDLLKEGLETKNIQKKHWAQVYSEDCEMCIAGQQAKGLEPLISGLPLFTQAFDIKPEIVEVIGGEDDSKFTVWYRHSARFVNPYGKVLPTGMSSVFEGVNIHTVDNEGLTTHLVQSMDLLSYFMQVGAISSIIDVPPQQELDESSGTVKVGRVKEL
ncbi:hypothetical protein DIPPA_20504 [Diplonema papillatum]|nr:hypothetical protein DIPPA_20504 [Diplonema papillatum]